ncbi:class I SAM-dependent methyltransferase [Cryobacterium sp. SO1]|uniref:class I SAM-dependent methyltransferase n=1 Tax=Cryobacterium sp. SO1 TaxID=1897061 RepID=UPI001F0E5D04|nr:class I SAM-dependent methyltransferase [Cryobacterium sp. SO1]
MSADVERPWDGQANDFDDEADHGLQDPRVRAAWQSLLAPLLPERPARIADLGCGTGSLAFFSPKRETRYPSSIFPAR